MIMRLNQERTLSWIPWCLVGYFIIAMELFLITRKFTHLKFASFLLKSVHVAYDRS